MTCHPLANPSISWEVPRFTDVEPRRGTGPGYGHRLPALVDALTEHELEGLVRVRHEVGLAVDVRGLLHDRRSHTGLDGRDRGCARRRSATARDRGPPPAAESRTSWSMFHPVHSDGALAHGGLWADAVWTMWGPAAERDPLGVGAARHHLHLTVVEGVLGGADDGDVDRLSVDGEQIGHAVAREGRRRRGSLQAGNPDLGDAERQCERSGGVVVLGVLGPDRGEGDDELRAGQRGEADRHGRGRAGHRAVGDRRERDRADLAARGDGHVVGTECRPSASTVKRNPAQCLRLRQVVGQRRPDVGAEVETGLPRGGRIVVERGRRGGVQVARHAARGVGRDVAVGRGGRPPHQLVDLVVGQQGGEAGAARDGEGAGGRDLELPGDGGLGIAPGRIRRGTQPGHHVGQPVRLPMRRRWPRSDRWASE